MGDKSILDFPEITDSQDTDKIYVVRGAAGDRDKQQTKANFLDSERAALSTEVSARESAVSDLETKTLGVPAALIKFGAGTGVGAVNFPRLGALSPTRIVYGDGTNDELRIYDYSSANDAWTQTGNSFSLSNVGRLNFAGFSFRRFAVADNNNATLTMYDFDETNITKVGNAYSILNSGEPCITAVANNRVIMQNNNSGVDAVQFDGTDWNLLGTHFARSTVNTGSITALARNRVAIVDDGTDTLVTFDFDENVFRQVGNAFNIASFSGVDPEIIALSSDLIVLYVNGGGGGSFLHIVRFNGNDWVLQGARRAVPSGQIAALSALSSDRIVFIEGNADTIDIYDLLYADPPLSPAFS